MTQDPGDVILDHFEVAKDSENPEIENQGTTRDGGSDFGGRESGVGQ